MLRCARNDRRGPALGRHAREGRSASCLKYSAWEDVVLVLDGGEPSLVKGITFDLTTETMEPQEVSFQSSGRIFRRRSGADHKCPVARLGQEQLPPGLIERTQGRALGPRVTPGQLFQPVGRPVKLRVDPIVEAVQPDFVEAFVSPARQRGCGSLIDRILLQIFGKRDEPNLLLLEGDLAHQMIQPARSFEPPVAEQFSIVMLDDYRLAI